MTSSSLKFNLMKDYRKLVMKMKSNSIYKSPYKISQRRLSK